MGSFLTSSVEAPEAEWVTAHFSLILHTQENSGERDKESSKDELTEVAQTAGGLRFGLGQCGQEHSGENCDDGDGNQQFDKSEAEVRFRPSARNPTSRTGALRAPQGLPIAAVKGGPIK